MGGQTVRKIVLDTDVLIFNRIQSFFDLGTGNPSRSVIRNVLAVGQGQGGSG